MRCLKRIIRDRDLNPHDSAFGRFAIFKSILGVFAFPQQILLQARQINYTKKTSVYCWYTVYAIIFS